MESTNVIADGLHEVCLVSLSGQVVMDGSARSPDFWGQFRCLSKVPDSGRKAILLGMMEICLGAVRIVHGEKLLKENRVEE